MPPDLRVEVQKYPRIKEFHTLKNSTLSRFKAKKARWL